MFLQWLGLTSAAVLCYARRWLAGSRCARSSLVVFALLVAEHGRDLRGRAVVRNGVRPHDGRRRAPPSASWPFLLRNDGICVIVTALLLRYFFVTHQWQHARARRGAFAHSGAAGAHPAALPVQQHEYDRGAHAQRSRARRGSGRGSRGPVPRHAARLAQPAAPERGARAHAHLSAHRSAASRRPAQGDAGTWPSCRCARSCRGSRCSRCSRTRSTTASSRCRRAAR